MQDSDAPKGQDNTTEAQHDSQNSGALRSVLLDAKNPPTPTASCYPYHHAKPLPWWKRLATWQFVAEIAIFIVGVRVAFIYSGQLDTMNNTYTQIVNQTASIKAANEISRTTTAVSQRAYIYYPGNPVRMMPSVIRETGGKGWVIFAQLQNGGNTPAFKVVTTFNDNFPEFNELGKDFKYPALPNRKMFPNSEVNPGPRIVGAHGEASGGAMTIAERDLKRVNTGASHIYLWGTSVYNDVFGCSHKTEVCWQVVQFGSLNGNTNIAMADCTEHNCADQDCEDYTPTKAPVCSLENEPLKEIE